MAVRINSIQSPREEMAELRGLIEHEKEIRRSLRISTREEYFNTQKAYLEEQIAVLQNKLRILTESFQQGESRIEESFQRQAKYERRYAMLVNRNKIEKLDKLKAEIEKLQAQVGG